MVDQLQLLRNVGAFDSVAPGAQLPFRQLTLIYAENGRGKTTLASVLRSLGNGDPLLIAERQRLTAANPPHIVIGAGAAVHTFQNGAWNNPLPSIAVFDDGFVSQNVCSGIEIAAEHRENLHELILGAQGVALNAVLQGHVARVEQHIRDLRDRGNAIPATLRGDLTLDEFCALANDPELAQRIQVAERSLSAARAADEVRNQPAFVAPALPTFDKNEINAMLARDLPGVEAEASNKVQAHLATLGGHADAWVADGMNRIGAASTGRGHEVCPFCDQDLRASPIIAQYRAYFSEAYSGLKAAVANMAGAIARTHGGDIPAAFERSVLTATKASEFWGKFTDVPAVTLDTAAIALAWKVAREAVLTALQQKEAAPLERMALSRDAEAALEEFAAQRAAVEILQTALQPINTEVALVKEAAANANLLALTGDLRRLKAIEARYTQATALLCDAYLAEKAAKTQTEIARDRARDALDEYRVAVFPAYETAINEYLRRFNAGFRLSAVRSVNNRGGSSCTYNVVINNVEVPVNTETAGAPSFRSTLSAGDRNTLALAFFFASLDRDPNLANKIVVIDDPMTSLDENRSLTTVHQTRRLVGRVSQVIVLSHSRNFLCELWKGRNAATSAALKIVRNVVTGQNVESSTLVAWDVQQESITEHDKNYALVTSFIAGAQGVDERDVAEALRPMLEAVVRVTYANDFPAGALLGPFLNRCTQRVGTPQEIMAQTNITELNEILDYANRFHHDNPGWQTELINHAQLLQFAQRTMGFARRP